MSRVLLLVALMGACASRRATTQPPATQETPMVIVRPKGGPEQRVKVELARTEAETRRGLMYREKLAPDAGMLFLFPVEKHQAFWMKNTFIPLDIIFITHEKKVLGVAENCAPMTERPLREVPGDSQYVLEVVGGWARAHRVGAGADVEFVNVD